MGSEMCIRDSNKELPEPLVARFARSVHDAIVRALRDEVLAQLSKSEREAEVEARVAPQIDRVHVRAPPQRRLDDALVAVLRAYYCDRVAMNYPAAHPLPATFQCPGRGCAARTKRRRPRQSRNESVLVLVVAPGERFKVPPVGRSWRGPPRASMWREASGPACLQAAMRPVATRRGVSVCGTWKLIFV